MNPTSKFLFASFALWVCMVPPCESATAADGQIVSSATYQAGPVARGSLVSVLGSGLGAYTAIPYPDQPSAALAGVSITVTDSDKETRPAAILFVSPLQVNFLLPSDCSPGPATVTIARGGAEPASFAFTIASSAPGLFSVDGSGAGPAISQILRVRSDGNADARTGTDGGDSQVFLFLYGTGIREAESVEATANGEKLAVLFAGAEGGSPGLDQVNVQLPASLPSGQRVDLIVIADGQPSNTLSFVIE